MKKGKFNLRLLGKGGLPIPMLPRGRLIAVCIMMTTWGMRVLMMTYSSTGPLTTFSFPLISH